MKAELVNVIRTDTTEGIKSRNGQQWPSAGNDHPVLMMAGRMRR